MTSFGPAGPLPAGQLVPEPGELLLCGLGLSRRDRGRRPTQRPGRPVSGSAGQAQPEQSSCPEPEGLQEERLPEGFSQWAHGLGGKPAGARAADHGGPRGSDQGRGTRVATGRLGVLDRGPAGGVEADGWRGAPAGEQREGRGSKGCRGSGASPLRKVTGVACHTPRGVGCAARRRAGSQVRIEAVHADQRLVQRQGALPLKPEAQGAGARLRRARGTAAAAAGAKQQEEGEQQEGEQQQLTRWAA